MECKDEPSCITSTLRRYRFRWVFCQLEVLKKCPPIRAALRKALRRLPATLDETYARVLESIEDETCQELARRCLVWLAFSKTPLSLEQLADAAVIGTGSFDPEDRISDPQFILELLGSLVVVASDEYLVEDSSTIAEWVVYNGIGVVGLGVVRLAHFSVKEYLTSERIVQSAVSKFALGDAMAHRQIAEACLLYLDFFQQLESEAISRLTPPTSSYVDFWARSDLPISADLDISPYPLLGYACYFWWHLRQIPLRKQRSLDDIIRRLFHETVASGFPVWIMARTYRDYIWEENVPTLQIFSQMGLEGAVQLELESGAHVDARDQRQQTALHLAVRR